MMSIAPEGRPMPLTHDEAFLEDICDHPDDEATRLIYADWLDDRGDAACAEFIRVQVALRKSAPDDDRHDDLVRRESALLQEHEAGWRAELPALEGVNWENFSGGFVEAVFVNSVEVFLRQSAAIFAAAPIHRLRVGRIGAADALLFSECAALARLTELNLGENPTLGPAGVHALSRSPHLANLRSLLLHNNELGNGAVDDLARSPYLGLLEELYLAGNDLDDDGVRLLVEGKHWRHLADLDLRDNRIGDDGVLAVGSSTSLPALSTLYLVNNLIRAAGATALAWAEGLPRLARLFLNYNPVGDLGAVAFALSHRRQALRDLDLRQAGIRDKGGEALAEADALDGLDLLWLRGNHFRRGTVMSLRRRYGRRLLI
jgi:uncharacterized protein (TIGR02996 family)